MPNSTTPIPIIMLSGFLGAGKTTLLNHLLTQEATRKRNPTLLINEFGTLGVDGALIKDRALRRYEINAGSLFCSCTTAELIKALRDIAENVQPELVLIEATGVAAPADLLKLLNVPDLAAKFAEPVVITLVDARQFPATAAGMQAARQQVYAADGLVINKADLIPPAEMKRLQAALENLNPAAGQTVTEQGRVPADWVLNMPKRAHADIPPAEAPPNGVVSVSIAAADPFDRNAFIRIVESLRPRLLRLKGNIDFGAGPRFVEWVGEEQIIHDSEPAAPLSGLPTRFAVIAFDIPKGQLQNAFLDARK